MNAPAPPPADGAVLIEVRGPDGWFPVCARDRLLPGRGQAALLPDGTQIALFLDRAGQPYALGNRDPFTGARVLSRGLLGSAGAVPYVASPLLKQRFALTDGRCLDDGTVSVPVYPARTRPAPAADADARPAGPSPGRARR